MEKVQNTRAKEPPKLRFVLLPCLMILFGTLFSLLGMGDALGREAVAINDWLNPRFKGTEILQYARTEMNYSAF